MGILCIFHHIDKKLYKKLTSKNIMDWFYVRLIAYLNHRQKYTIKQLKMKFLINSRLLH